MAEMQPPQNKNPVIDVANTLAQMQDNAADGDGAVAWELRGWLHGPMGTWYAGDGRAALRETHGSYPASAADLESWPAFYAITKVYKHDLDAVPAPAAAVAVAEAATAAADEAVAAAAASAAKVRLATTPKWSCNACTFADNFPFEKFCDVCKVPDANEEEKVGGEADSEEEKEEHATVGDAAGASEEDSEVVFAPQENEDSPAAPAPAAPMLEEPRTSTKRSASATRTTRSKRPSKPVSNRRSKLCCSGRVRHRR